MEVIPEDVMNAWNVNCGDLPRCHGLSFAGRRSKTLKICEKFDLQTIVKAIKIVAASDFCNGRIPTKDSPNGFRANYGWFVNEGIIEQALEGQFKNEPIPPQNPSPKDLGYWNEQKPDAYEPTEEQFLRNQMCGRLALMFERANKRKYVIDHRDIAWIDDGGQHHWADAVQVEQARREVMLCREGASEDKCGRLVPDARNRLPSTYDEAVGRIRRAGGARVTDETGS